jgi:pSer/pThr/pTyr-binding forkhead associated (FHA) protein
MSDSSRRQNAARLVALNGDFEGMVYALDADETMIGRNPTTDITLLDDGISREHAIISFEAGMDGAEDEYAVEDLQSTNGTKVNGKRVRSATLQPGDEIRIGNTSFRFEMGSPFEA